MCINYLANLFAYLLSLTDFRKKGQNLRSNPKYSHQKFRTQDIQYIYIIYIYRVLLCEYSVSEFIIYRRKTSFMNTDLRKAFDYTPQIYVLTHNFLTSIAQLIKASEYARTGRYPVQASAVFLHELVISLSLSLSFSLYIYSSVD